MIDREKLREAVAAAALTLAFRPDDPDPDQVYDEVLALIDAAPAAGLDVEIGEAVSPVELAARNYILGLDEPEPHDTEDYYPATPTDIYLDRLRAAVYEQRVAIPNTARSAESSSACGISSAIYRSPSRSHERAEDRAGTRGDRPMVGGDMIDREKLREAVRALTGYTNGITIEGDEVWAGLQPSDAEPGSLQSMGDWFQRGPLLALIDAAPGVQAPSKPRAKRIDWSNVVVDEGDESP